MPFQTQIHISPAPGVPGTHFSLNPEVVTVKIAAENVTVGRFVWLGDTPDTVRNSGTGTPLGFAIVTKTEAGMEAGVEASMIIRQGNPVTVVTAGEYFALANTEAVPGQKVFASLTDGGISTGDAGADIAGSIETTFKVLTAAPVGEPFGISNRRP